MNMNKILATGLLVTLLYPVSEAGAVPCGNGGFYVGANLGVSLTKMKYRNSVDEQTDVIDFKTIPEEGEWNPGAGAAPEAGRYYKVNEFRTMDHPVSGTSLKKNKTKFLAELNIGYDHRINDVMLGIDINFGMRFGKLKKSAKGLALSNGYVKKEDIEAAAKDVTLSGAASTWSLDDPQKNYDTNAQNGWDGGQLISTQAVKGSNKEKYNSEQEAQIKVKNKFNISIMPRIGYLITPQCELYITAGALFTSNKYTISANTGTKEAPNWESATKSKSKIAPVVGGGIRYEFSENVFTKLEYNYCFKAKMKKAANDVDHKLDQSSHDVKLGIGYRF